MTRPVEPVRLLDADPDLAVDIDASEVARARRDVVVATFPLELDEEAVLSQRSDHAGLIGFFVIDGLLMREIEVAGTAAAEIVGTGDLIHPGDIRGGDLAPVHGRVNWTVLSRARLALLDGAFTARAAPWPQIIARIALRAVWRTHGLALSLAISHKNRIGDRLLLLFWHLAQRFGRVGVDGVHLELPVTHEALGKLVGAQRPSVTSALGLLGERGLVVRCPDRSWLLPLPIPDEIEPLLSRRALLEQTRGPTRDAATGLAAQP